MKKIIIIGGGFAGIAAADLLSKYRNQFDITLIDKKPDFNFLPMLPDVISNRVSVKFLRCSLSDLAAKWGIKFINAFVHDVCLEENKILYADNALNYDYLVLAAGSETNFYNDMNLQKQAFKLDNLEDAVLILNDLNSQKYENFVICGGGYTGVEIATNIRRYFFKRKLAVKPIFIVEKSKEVLDRLPQWMQEYTCLNLKKMGIEVIRQAEVKAVIDGKIMLNNGKIFPKAGLIWAAGVKTPDFLSRIGLKTSFQGRVFVDEYLRINPNCFCVGDNAYIETSGQPLRMGVQFAIAQGCLAAKNIIRSIQRGKLKKYHALDLGYIIPMANNKACGIILGLKVTGLVAVFLHYLMCVFRSLSIRNRLGIIGNLWRKK
ncbi:MAG: FAD-dependent oxidoreductase [Candidatus Omnitrophica bacterium]|nr:FAD-dependent oxidoreductase [Candidatus Omnitrophota bacterium]